MEFRAEFCRTRYKLMAYLAFEAGKDFWVWRHVAFLNGEQCITILASPSFFKGFTRNKSDFLEREATQNWSYRFRSIPCEVLHVRETELTVDAVMVLCYFTQSAVLPPISPQIKHCSGGMCRRSTDNVYVSSSSCKYYVWRHNASEIMFPSSGCFCDLFNGDISIWTGACHSVVGWGTMLQATKETGSISDDLIGFFFT
jgi:hypothetical protein